MVPVRGRPRKICQKTIIKTVMAHKQEVLLPKGGIITKLDNVWQTISQELNNVISARSLYTFVTCNKYGLKNKLSCHNQDDINESNVTNDTSTQTNNVSDVSHNSAAAESNNFVFLFSRPEYESLLMNRAYKRTEMNRRTNYERQCTVLRSGKWREIFTSKIWETQRLKCAFNFKNHKINQDAKFGYVNGKCKCGSTIKCEIEDSNPEENFIPVKCRVTTGTDICGKQYLRAPDRQEIALKLVEKSTTVYRAQRADELMLPGDPEPPHLYKASVLNVAKNEYTRAQHIDQDPVKALAIMQLNSLKNIIHGLGLNPFFIHYWTNHQLHVYREYARREPACLHIDATGSIVQKISRHDKSKSHHIFLYECVVHCSVGGQYPVSQMLTESHTTNSINFWLMEWVRTGAPSPKEVVCDSSKALLTAVIRTFTGYSTVDDYADGFKLSGLPKCYIRIDVAHFIKMYARFMKDANQRVKKFFLTGIGQLILSRDVDSATEILSAILVVARSETEGDEENGQATYCEAHKMKLRDIFVGAKNIEDFIEETIDGELEDQELLEENVTSTQNSWATWAKAIDDRVKVMVSESEGNRDNAHFFPQLAVRLVKDAKWLPLWSCVYRNQFGYGRVPASSASVEGDFNNVKNRILKDQTLPMRADDFVKRHVDFINGQIKIVDAGSQQVNSPSLSAKQIEIDEPIVQAESQPSVAETEIVKKIAPTTSQLEASKTILCPVCVNGDYPTGAHVCALCSRPVHALDLCSTAMEGEEEGYGQRRICATCKDVDNLPTVFASREVEDWRGLGVKSSSKKKTSRYLQQSYTANEFILHQKLKRMPIMKNSGNITLQPVKLGTEKISLANTCAFDSILQIFLAAVQDRPLLREAFHIEAKKNLFYKLVLDILSKGLTNFSYRLRAQILRDFFPAISKPHNVKLVNCEVTVGHLAAQLFKNTPALTETSVCNKGCPPRQKFLVSCQILHSSLSQIEFIKIIEKEIAILEPWPCCSKDCTGTETTNITKMGDFVPFEPYSADADVDRRRIQLKNIPIEIEIPVTSENYQLIGVINFKPPTPKTRSSIDELGHYTAISLRPGNTWIRYDDTKEKEMILPGTELVYPHLIIYAR